MKNKEIALKYSKVKNYLNNNLPQKKGYTFCFHGHYDNPLYTVWLAIDGCEGNATFEIINGKLVTLSSGMYSDQRINAMVEIINNWLDK